MRDLVNRIATYLLETENGDEPLTPEQQANVDAQFKEMDDAHTAMQIRSAHYEKERQAKNKAYDAYKKKYNPVSYSPLTGQRTDSWI